LVSLNDQAIELQFGYFMAFSKQLVCVQRVNAICIDNSKYEMRKEN